MRKKIFRSLIFVLGINILPTIHAQESQKEYGSPGDFELSTGLSLLALNFSEYGNNYNLGLLPFANHYLWKRVFLRYNLGLIFNYYKPSGLPQSYQFGIEPGLAAGYSFGFSGNWYLNISAGYLATIAWIKNSYFPVENIASSHLAAYPELKYFIAKNWSLSLLTSIIPGSSSVTTNTYIVASHLF